MKKKKVVGEALPGKSAKSKHTHPIVLNKKTLQKNEPTPNKSKRGIPTSV